MVCIYCGGQTQVRNSRLQRRDNQVWRRRACLACGSVFTTEEKPVLTAALAVNSGHSGRLTAFSRDRLFVTIYEACKHRADPLKDAAYLTSVVISQILKLHTDGAVTRTDIIRTTIKALERFDRTAAVVYAAYHQV